MKTTLLVLLFTIALLGCSPIHNGVNYPQSFTFSTVKWKSNTFSPRSRFMQRNRTRDCTIERFNSKKGYFEASIDGSSGERIYSLGCFTPEQIVANPRSFLTMIRERQNELIQTESYAARSFVLDEKLVYDEVLKPSESGTGTVVPNRDNPIEKDAHCHITETLVNTGEHVPVPVVGEGYFFKRETKKDESESGIHFYRILLWLKPSDECNNINAVRQRPVKVIDTWFHFSPINVLAVCIQEAE